MSVCKHNNCRASESTNKLHKQKTTFNSPYCSFSTHIICAGLHKNTKQEIDNLYFVCNSCKNFLSYSGNLIQTNFETKICEINDGLLKLSENFSLMENLLHNSLNEINKKSSDIKFDVDRYFSEIGDKICIINNDLKPKALSLAQLTSQIANLETCYGNEIKLNSESISKIEKEFSSVSTGPSQAISQSLKESSTPLDSDIKYKLRISGVTEPNNLPNPHDRKTYDFDKVTEIASFLHTRISIRDVQRLGRFTPSATRPRTMLVTFNSF